MDKFVRRLFNDAEYQKEFLADPRGAIANSGLTGVELDAAERLAGDLRTALRSPSVIAKKLNSPTWF